jgi:hypothetical protein
MATKSSVGKSHKQRLTGLYGGLTPSQAVARRATAAKQKEQSTTFRRQEALRMAHARTMARVHAPMLKAFGKDAETVRAVSALKSLARQTRRQRLARPVVPVQKPRIVADLGATVVPPYDFQEVIFTTTGSPLDTLIVDKSTGSILTDVFTDEAQPSSAIFTAGVGIFFHPPTDCPGTLSLSVPLSFTYRWMTLCAWANAHSDGWVGLTVESFDLAGFPTGAVVDQQLSQWWDDSWWAGAGTFTGSHSAFPLAAQCAVDNQHFYHVWVRFGGTVAAAGWSYRFGGSGAESSIVGSVPSITWELT